RDRSADGTASSDEDLHPPRWLAPRRCAAPVSNDLPPRGTKGGRARRVRTRPTGGPRLFEPALRSAVRNGPRRQPARARARDSLGPHEMKLFELAELRRRGSGRFSLGPGREGFAVLVATGTVHAYLDVCPHRSQP